MNHLHTIRLLAMPSPHIPLQVVVVQHGVVLAGLVQRQAQVADEGAEGVLQRSPVEPARPRYTQGVH